MRRSQFLDSFENDQITASLLKILLERLRETGARWLSWGRSVPSQLLINHPTPRLCLQPLWILHLPSHLIV